jgi:putative transposase
VAVVDEEALLKICVYIDLNPVAAKVATTPETSNFTSIKQRVDHVEAQGKTAELAAAEGGSVAGSRASAGLEESLWLCPIEDRRGLDFVRVGMIQGFPLGSYVKLVEYTGRLFRQGKASISAEPAGIFERLGFTAETWGDAIGNLRGERLLGRIFAASRIKLRAIAKHLGVRHPVNLTGCPLR